MKSILISALTIICGTFAALADEPAPDAPGIPDDIEVVTNAAPVVAETLFADGRTNTWTQADLTDALGLMNRKYHRDIESESGRAKWHGKRMGQYLIDVEDGKKCLVLLYEDGFAWTNAATRVSLKDPEVAAKAKAAAEARQAEWERTHLPPDVAALLQRRREAAK